MRDELYEDIFCPLSLNSVSSKSPKMQMPESSQPDYTPDSELLSDPNL